MSASSSHRRRSGPTPAAIRAYAQAAEELGFTHLTSYDHVLGADPAGHPGFSGPYTAESMFHEPFVLYGYLAAVAPKLELVTGIIILPQRQTVLVAKQAAEVDILTGGRFRLGVGQGWNAVEYEALGMDWDTRGRRMEEQIELLRRLWQEPVLSFEGRFHTITAAGINPLPVQRPIPIWMGGSSVRGAETDRAARRRLLPAAEPARRGLGRDARADARVAARGRPRPGRPGHRGAHRHRHRDARGLARRSRGVARARCDAPLGQHDARRPRRSRGSHCPDRRGAGRDRGELKQQATPRRRAPRSRLPWMRYFLSVSLTSFVADLPLVASKVTSRRTESEPLAASSFCPAAVGRSISVTLPGVFSATRFT